MALTVRNNMMAANAARNLNNAYNSLSVSTRRLSSGLRVTSAKDDAAGLAVRELLRADISTLRQGARNANDAISMLQTADGSLEVVDEKLIRMRELAEQAATGTYSETQRALIDSEYQAMASEISRIARATDFNGVHLLNGQLSADDACTIHFGTGNSSSEDYYSFSITECTCSALGIGHEAQVGDAGYTISTQEQAASALTAVNSAIAIKDNLRAYLGGIQNRLEATIANLEIQAENLQASESRISDVDVATEMTVFTSNQIISQSAAAMLTQANSLPQVALQLLQG